MVGEGGEIVYLNYTIESYAWRLGSTTNNQEENQEEK